MDEPKKGPEKLKFSRKNKTGSSSPPVGKRHLSTGSINTVSVSNTPKNSIHDLSPRKLNIPSNAVTDLNDSMKNSDSIDSFIDYSAPKRNFSGGAVSEANSIKSPLKDIPEHKSYFGSFLSAVGAVTVKPKKEEELTQDEENDLFLLNVYEKNKKTDASKLSSGSRTSWFLKQYQSTKKMLVEEFEQVIKVN